MSVPSLCKGEGEENSFFGVGRAGCETSKAIHQGMFGQMIVRRLFSEHNVLTQACGNNFLVFNVATPLVLEEDIETIVSSMYSAKFPFITLANPGKML